MAQADVETGGNPYVVSRRVSWGAALAGAFVGTAVQLALMLLGTTIGMGAVDPQEGISLTALTWSGALWMIFVSLVSVFSGAFVAARLANIPKVSVGIMHGLLVWSIATVSSFFLFSTLIGTAVVNVGSMVGSAAEAAQSALMDAVASNEKLQQELRTANLDLDTIRREAREILKETRNPRLEKTVEAEQRQLQQIGREAAKDILASPGNIGTDIDRMIDRMITVTQDTWQAVSEDDIANVLVARTDMTEKQARDVASRWKKNLDQVAADMQSRYDKMKSEALKTADDAMARLAMVGLVGFVALLLGAVAGFFGGWYGTPRTADVVHPSKNIT